MMDFGPFNLNDQSFPDFSSIFLSGFTIACFKIHLVAMYLLLKHKAKLQNTMATLFPVSTQNLKVV